MSSYLANLLVESGRVQDDCLVSSDTLQRIAYDNGLLIETAADRAFVMYRGIVFYAVVPAVSA